MKRYVALFAIALLAITSAFAQKSGLINSGELLKQGGLLHDSSRYKQALLVYDKISRSDTNYVRSLYERALSCEADSQYAKAIAYCREGLALKDKREYEPDIYAVYGSTLSDMQKYDEAIKIFDEGIAKYPVTPGLFFNKGIAYMGQKRFANAEAQFQKTLLINPYLYSAHYRLALAALQQGKIVPAFLSCTAYLFVCPQGRYFSPAINMLSAISKVTDEIMAFKNNRTETPDADYQLVEEILLSKIALDKQYKPIIALDDQISRQIQVVFEKMEYNSQNKDFYMQYYLPYLKQVFKSGKFELFINSAFSNANVPVVKEYNKKNRKEIDALLDEAGNYFNNIRSTQLLNYSSRDTVTQRYVYENGKLVGKGVLINNGKTLIGPWSFYYAAGNLKGTGLYTQAGERTGQWKFYNVDGTPKSVEQYVNGKQNGLQDYYHDNGAFSSHETELNGQLDGPATVYYYGGAKKREVMYKAGKKDGPEKAYYPNGNLQSSSIYTAGILNGPYKEYYKTGIVKEAGVYVNGDIEGPCKMYNEAGGASADMVFIKGKVNGEWKSYYDSGKLKEKRNYMAEIEDGPHQEYFDNGQPAENYTAKKGKINGEATYYSKTGKVYSTFIYDNGVIKAVKFMDPAGKQLFASELKNDLIDVISFTPDGVKKSHAFYNGKGELTGADTIFYPSGKVNQISQYKNGELNGPMLTYYLNGQKKWEVNMTDGKNDGYYESYYMNGLPESEGWIKAGESQGEWVYYDAMGKLSSKNYYVDGELSGYKEDFDPSGKKTIEQKYDTGLLQEMTQYDDNGKVIATDIFPKGAGKYTLHFPNGKVRVQGTFINGNLNGAYQSFYFDGSLEVNSFYKAGDLDSTYTAYYYGGVKQLERKYHYGSKAGISTAYNEDGTLSNTINYVNDVASGERLSYDISGSKDFIMNYKDGLSDGLTQKFDTDGKTLAYQIMFDNDAAVSYSYQGTDGKLVPFIPIANINGLFKSFYANGKVSRESGYADGVKHGKTIVYYSNGQLRSDDTMVYGTTDGHSKEYYPDGKLMSESFYVLDNLDGVAKEYYKSGTLKKESVYMYGNNHGPVKYYDEAGKLTKTMLYNYGNLISVKNEK
jgi:antitoxin component YwqK of YwqJK toxin-antitoxin module